MASEVGTNLGPQLHFSMEAGELVVKSQAEQRLLQLIPHDKLTGDFPENLVFNYVHWLNLENGTLEFRPLEQAWSPQSSNWHLSFGAKPGTISTMTQGHRTLVDMPRNPRILPHDKVGFGPVCSYC